MKKEILIVALIFLTVIFNALTESQTITGETITITGKLPYSQTSINISVSDTIYPSVFINKPKNITYHNYNLLDLSLYAYDLSVIQAAWYNIDNGNNNSLSVSGTSVAYNTTFNDTEGSHFINFYANDFFGNENLTTQYFSINNSRTIVIYEKFKENETTTDFDNLAEEQYHNTTFILANQFGRITIIQTVNLTEYENTSTNEIDLDVPANISYNRISLDTSVLTSFSSIRSELRLYNLNFTNPRILKDGQVCSSPACIIESYNSSNGNFVFNVTGFSVYSAEETPTEEPETPVGPGGGGGAAIPLQKQIQFNQSSIKIKLRQGETKKVYLKIENIGQTSLDVDLRGSYTIEEFLKIKEEKFKLDVEGEKEIEIEVTAKEKILPEIYVGKIIAESAGVKEEMVFVIEVESKDKIFDVDVKIPERFKEVVAGESIFANITIQNLEKFALTNVRIDYMVINDEGKITVSEQETISLGNQVNFIKEMKIPKKAKSGEYIFYVKISYEDKVRSESEIFRITKIERPLSVKNFIIISIIIIIILFLILIISQFNIMKKLSKKYKELVGKKTIFRQKRKL